MLDDGIRTPPQYDRILARSQALQFSMNSDVLTGSLLRALARTKRDASLLELGTGCGLGTCWLLDGMSSGSRLISVENDPRVHAVARDELETDHRLTLVLGDGGKFIEECQTRFDLIYADAWPGKYTHLEEVLALLAPGGIYVIDDMLPQPNWPADHAPKVAALLAALDAATDIETAKLSWSTGVVIAVKR
jgi:predicted O-methyltransferase YrrM